MLRRDAVVPPVYVDRFYIMNPETDELLIDGNELNNDMVVLIECNWMRPSLNHANRCDVGYWSARKYNRWCTVTQLRYVDLETPDPIVVFIGVYSDGSKAKFEIPIDFAWYVRLNSMPTDLVKLCEEPLDGGSVKAPDPLWTQPEDNDQKTQDLGDRMSAAYQNLEDNPQGTGGMAGFYASTSRLDDPYYRGFTKHPGEVKLLYVEPLDGGSMKAPDPHYRGFTERRGGTPIGLRYKDLAMEPYDVSASGVGAPPIAEEEKPLEVVPRTPVIPKELLEDKAIELDPKWVEQAKHVWAGTTGENDKETDTEVA